jgi:uncharacterized protein YndB with AHSA1/START domain
MIDIIKKIYDWENNPSLIRDVDNDDVRENLFDDEINELTEEKEELTFFEKLFRMVLAAKEAEKKTPFKVFYLKEDMLIGKVKGLYSQLPLEKMAWQYPAMEHWRLVFPTLQGVEIKCIVKEAAPTEDGRYHIVVDATSHTPHKAELIDNAEYTGIVLQRTEDELLLDMGSHFRWKYGSLCGYLPLEELGTPETFQSCQPGDKISVEYRGSDERGLLFGAVQAIDLATEYIGKMTWVQIVRGENTAPYFMVEGKYKGDLPVTKTHYPTKKKKVRKLREKWENGDIIQCEILEYSPKRGLILKWIDDEPDEINWQSDEMTAYVGRKVPVFVYYTDDYDLRFLVENQFPAMLTARDRSSKVEHLLEGQVITAQVRSIDEENKCFKIRWVPWWDKESNSIDDNDDDNDDE